jgi:GT2 family glycosyltransferase
MDTASGSKKIHLSIVIVNWNVRDLLRQCLHSILNKTDPHPDHPGEWSLQSTADPLQGKELAACRFEIIVVDSASSDDSVDMLRQEFPNVRLYASERNLGYAGGNNLGMRESQGQYVLLLNPDTKVVGDALSTMMTYLEAHSGVGALGPQLRDADGSIQSSRRRFPTLGTALIESTFLQKWFPNHRTLHRYYVLDLPDDAIGQVDWVNGSCILVRRTVIEQVGLLDEAYFMYSEELDWQKRMRAAGWQIVYLPTARVIHYEGKSSEQVRALTHIRFSRSKVRYFYKHHGSLAGWVVRAWLLLNYVYEWAVEALKWTAGHERTLRRERMRAYCQVLRSGLRIQ